MSVNLSRSSATGGVPHPAVRVRATFRAALPYVVSVPGGDVLNGSRSPIPLEPEEGRRRLFDPQPPPATAEINLDLFPRDEFHSPD